MNQKWLRNTDLTIANIVDQIKVDQKENHRLKKPYVKCWWTWLQSRGQFQQHFTFSFYVCRSRKCKIQSSHAAFCPFGIYERKSCAWTSWWNWPIVSTPVHALLSNEDDFVSNSCYAHDRDHVCHHLQVTIRKAHELQVTSLLKQNLQITKLHWTP